MAEAKAANTPATTDGTNETETIFLVTKKIKLETPATTIESKATRIALAPTEDQDSEESTGNANKTGKGGKGEKGEKKRSSASKPKPSPASCASSAVGKKRKPETQTLVGASAGSERKKGKTQTQEEWRAALAANVVCLVDVQDSLLPILNRSADLIPAHEMEQRFRDKTYLKAGETVETATSVAVWPKTDRFICRSNGSAADVGVGGLQVVSAGPLKLGPTVGGFRKAEEWKHAWAKVAPSGTNDSAFLGSRWSTERFSHKPLQTNGERKEKSSSSNPSASLTEPLFWCVTSSKKPNPTDAKGETKSEEKTESKPTETKDEQSCAFPIMASTLADMVNQGLATIQIQIPQDGLVILNQHNRTLVVPREWVPEKELCAIRAEVRAFQQSRLKDLCPQNGMEADENKVSIKTLPSELLHGTMTLALAPKTEIETAPTFLTETKREARRETQTEIQKEPKNETVVKVEVLARNDTATSTTTPEQRMTLSNESAIFDSHETKNPHEMALGFAGGETRSADVSNEKVGVKDTSVSVKLEPRAT